MSGYKYRGTNHDTDTPLPRQINPFDPTKCGTYAGYRQHENTGTPKCRPCKDAATRYKRARKQEKEAA